MLALLHTGNPYGSMVHVPDTMLRVRQWHGPSKEPWSGHQHRMPACAPALGIPCMPSGTYMAASEAGLPSQQASLQHMAYAQQYAQAAAAGHLMGQPMPPAGAAFAGYPPAGPQLQQPLHSSLSVPPGGACIAIT